MLCKKVEIVKSSVEKEKKIPRHFSHLPYSIKLAGDTGADKSAT